MPTPVTRNDVEAAARRIAGHIVPTRTLRSRALSNRFRCEVYLKYEHEQRSGSFKWRGVNNFLLHAMEDAELENPVFITHSSGNHGLALAEAARRLDARSIVVVPDNASPAKVSRIRAAGAEVVVCPATLEGRRRTADAIVAETGGMLVHPHDHPWIMAGQGTIALELTEQVDRLEAILVAVGGGGLLAGCCAGASDYSRVIGVEPDGAAAAHGYFVGGAPLPTALGSTFADAVRVPLAPGCAHVISHYRPLFGRVPDSAIVDALSLLAVELGRPLEPSAAIPLAYLLRYPERLAGKRLALVLCGGNV